MISDRGSVKDRIVHPALLRERAKINFNRDEMIKIIWIAENHKYRTEVGEFAASHTLFSNKPDFYNASREEKMETNYEKFYELNQRLKNLNIKINTMQMNELIHMVTGNPPTELHFWMFTLAIKNLATDEQ